MDCNKNENIDIKQILEYRNLNLSSELRLKLKHPVTQGDHSEYAWIEFLRSFLPSKFSVDKGFVYDSKGQVSKQIDIIIYDSLYTPLIFKTSSGEAYVTSESVYAIFEVKQNVDGKNIKAANEKINSVKNLYRTSRDIMVGGDKKPGREAESLKIIGGILSTGNKFEGDNNKGVLKETLIDHLKTNTGIDLGCSAMDYTFIVGEDSNGLRDVDNMIFTDDRNKIIINFFYIIIDELYKRGTVPAADIRKYGKTYVEGIKFLEED